MLNPSEEAKFAKLKAMCRELKVSSPPEVFIGLKVHDKDGILIFDDKQRGHSWTRNFWNWLYGAAAVAGGSGSNNFGAGYLSGKDTAANVGYNAAYAACTAWATVSVIGTGYCYGSAGATGGIVLGTGDTAFSVEQAALIVLIAHGNAASQLYYQAMGAPTMAYTAGTKTWKTTHSRIFNNNSGGSITIKEVGLYASDKLYDGGGNASYHMWERSVLSPTVSVANGAQLTVTYEISMDFSAID